MEDVASADRITRHARDHRLWTSAYLTLQIQNIESLHTLVIGITGFFADSLIATRTKSEFTRARQNHHAYIFIIAGIIERMRHLLDSQRPKSISNFRPVHNYLGNALRFFINNVGVGLGHEEGFKLISNSLQRGKMFFI